MTTTGGVTMRARIDQIDIYEPPYLLIGASWTRYGMATVKTQVSIIKTFGSTTQTLATRVVKAVLNETPYPGPFGPLQSCQELAWNGEFSVHWGAATAVSGEAGSYISLPNNWSNKMHQSIPRAVPPTPKLDLLYGYNDNVVWNALKTNLGGSSIEDPWFAFYGGTDVQPFVGGAFGSPQVNAPVTTGQDHSNIFRNIPGVNCPDFDYDTWKQIAQSGGSDVHYYAWDNGNNYRENGAGAATAFTTLTDGKTGLFFFDTTDGIAPHDPDSHGVAANLAPSIQITGNSYGVRGMLYMNVNTWTSNGNPGKSITMHWPGDPILDRNQNGVYDAGDDFLPLDYTGAWISDPRNAAHVVAAANYGTATYVSRGPDIAGEKAVVWGLLYVSGDFDAQGTPLYYGSVVTKAGNNGSMAGTPDLFWDTDLKDNWPPPGWDLPRVIITKWQTDL